jgi:hypothetical protein
MKRRYPRNPVSLAQRAAALALAPLYPVRHCIDRALAADAFDQSAASWLARRDRYAEAASLLKGIARPPRTTNYALLILHERNVAPDVRLFRLAGHYGAIADCDGETRPMPTRAALRKSAAGRIALAATGDLPNWSRASKRERAAYVLSRIIAERGP